MIVLGVLILLALGTLVIGLAIQGQKAKEAVFEPTGAPTVPLAASPAAPNSSLLPAGAEIRASHTADKHLVVEYIDPESGELALAVIELRSGRLLYRVAP